VLSVNGNDAFLIADCNLDSQPYNTTKTDVTWETSTIRSWLNGYKASYNANGINYSSNNFIDKAFTSAEQKAINQVTVVNHDNTEYETEGGNDTKDKVFLLSIEEVTNPDYGFLFDISESDSARGRKNTAYAKEQGADTISDMEGDYAKYNGNGFWWLRSPGSRTFRATNVTNDGCVSIYGDGVNFGLDAVCPALHLNLSSASVWSDAGTVCTDGTVNEIKPSVSTGGNTGDNTGNTTGGNTGNNTQKPGGQTQNKTPAKKGTVAVTGTRKKGSKITIPATVTKDGYTFKVTEIAAKAFQNNKKLTTLVLGANIRKIGTKSFYKNSKLKSITFKNKNAVKIGSQAFKGIKATAKVTVPKKMTAKNFGKLKKAMKSAGKKVKYKKK